MSEFNFVSAAPHIHAALAGPHADFLTTHNVQTSSMKMFFTFWSFVIAYDFLTNDDL